MLTFRFTPAAQLTSFDLDVLWRVYSQAFASTREQFEHSVRAADEAVLYRAQGRLCGMALVSTFTQEHLGRRFRVVWTGSVFIEPEFRGDNAIQRSALVRLARERLRHPLTPLYWFFDTFSYKSYLLMARNFGVFWPRRELPMPAWEKGVLDALCESRHGALFDPVRGVIGARGKLLQPGVADLPSKIDDPNLAFFSRTNPRAAAGECLACLAPLSAGNLARIVVRMGLRALRKIRWSSAGSRKGAQLGA